MKTAKIVSLLLFLCTAASAQENKLLVQGGLQHTNSSTRGDGAGMVVRYERSITEWLSVGPEYSYHGPFEITPENGPVSGTFTAHVFMADAAIYTPKKKGFQGYAILAVGGALYDFHESADIKSRDISVDGGWSFAYKLGVGFDYDLAGGWILNAEWYYFDTRIRKSAHYSDGSFSNILDTGPTLGHNETAVMVGLGKKFDALTDLFHI